MKNITIYTDGSCHGNPGAGGWAAILQQDGQPDITVQGSDWYTTNHRMEMQAIIEGLRRVTPPCAVNIVTDSKTIADRIRKGDLQNWIAAAERKNTDLWEQILALTLLNQVTATWVKGHSQNEMNRRCDYLANNEASGIQLEAKRRQRILACLLLDNAMTTGEICCRTGCSPRLVEKYRAQYELKQGVIT